MTTRVALLGTGLIGGSIGLALMKLPDIEEVVAYDLDPDAGRRAVERGAASRAVHSVGEAVGTADLVPSPWARCARRRCHSGIAQPSPRLGR